MLEHLHSRRSFMRERTPEFLNGVTINGVGFLQAVKEDDDSPGLAVRGIFHVKGKQRLAKACSPPRNRRRETGHQRGLRPNLRVRIEKPAIPFISPGSLICFVLIFIHASNRMASLLLSTFSAGTVPAGRMTL